MAGRGDALLSPEQLSTLHIPKNLMVFRGFGGLAGLERGLWTDLRGGPGAMEMEVQGSPHLDEAVTLNNKKRIFFDKYVPVKKQPTFPSFIYCSETILKDITKLTLPFLGKSLEKVTPIA
ncbi:hypothetical protein HRG_014847 [Hirsutella rhossiliensis]